MVCEDSETAGRVLGQLKATVRRNYSSPPSFGAQVVATVLNDAALKATWQAEVDAMRAHILTMRQALVDALQQVAPGSKVDYLLKQRGMFSYTGFSAAQGGSSARRVWRLPDCQRTHVRGGVKLT